MSLATAAHSWKAMRSGNERRLLAVGGLAVGEVTRRGRGSGGGNTEYVPRMKSLTLMPLLLLACSPEFKDPDPGDDSSCDALTWYFDGDGDGAGAPAPFISACVAPDEWVADATDCDDALPGVHPGAAEVCDGVDQDCDSEPDDGVPNDGAGCVEPVAPTWDDAVGDVHITVRTDSDTSDGTDDYSEVCLSASECFTLDNADWNDNEAGATDEFIHAGVALDRSTLDRLLVRISDGSDQWQPECVAVSLDGEPYFCATGITAALGDASGEVLEWTDPVAIGCLGCYEAPLTHGPMVGATGPDFMTLWYRTDATRRVAVHVAASEAALETSTPVHVSWPAPERDFTDTVRIGGLGPDTVYWYAVEVEGSRFGPWQVRTSPAGPGPLTLAFGSCAKDAEQPMFSVIEALAPDVFVFVGDNHYGNTPDLDSNRQNYRAALAIPDRRALLQHTPTLATWDDHDYVGDNTDGSSAGKDDALHAFSEYWANGSYGTDEVAGVYSAHSLGDVDVILLDDRYWRGLDDSVLGDAQEAWLYDVLRSSTATFKLVATGSQMSLQGSSDSWASFPEAQGRFMDFLADESISGVVVLSGDIHRSEFRLLPGATGGYSVPELTSSPLANSTSSCSHESEEMECYDAGPSFVALDIDSSLADPALVATIYDEAGLAQASWTLLGSELR